MSTLFKKKERFRTEQDDADVDLVPLIDCVFLLLLFFMLCGRMTMDQRTEQITVPPTRTATEVKDPKDFERIVINVFGSTKTGNPPRNTIRIGNVNYVSSGPENLESYQKLRQVLDVAYDRADKIEDPKKSGLMLPKVVLEIRADADTEYRVVQEVQQVVSDSINPFDGMKPKAMTDPKQAKPFVYLNFTTRKPGDN
jgi:biopolymer transport protein ExbD